LLVSPTSDFLGGFATAEVGSDPFSTCSVRFLAAVLSYN